MAATGMMTVEEFRKLPEGPFYYELRHGEPVQVAYPKCKHILIQNKLQFFFARHSGANFFTAVEFPFRALPEHEFRAADVAAVSRSRLKNADIEADFMGSPDLVVEVLSPSNTADEINDKERLCLETGCLEFWEVDPKQRQVRVSKPDGTARTYKAGQEIPLDVFGAATLPVNEIFS